MSTQPLERIRHAERDDDELGAVIDALHQGHASVHQIAAALGIADNELGVYLACRSTEINAPSALRRGDIIVSTQLTANTLIRVEQPYRRLIGEPDYSAEVTMPGNRRQRVTRDLLDRWLPAQVVRSDMTSSSANMSVPRCTH